MYCTGIPDLLLMGNCGKRIAWNDEIVAVTWIAKAKIQRKRKTNIENKSQSKRKGVH
jgi:hypothetical protein